MITNCFGPIVKGRFTIKIGCIINRVWPLAANFLVRLSTVLDSSLSYRELRYGQYKVRLTINATKSENC